MTIQVTKHVPYRITKDGKHFGTIQDSNGEWIFCHELKTEFYGMSQTKISSGFLKKDEMLEVIKLIDSLECIK